MIPLRLHIKNFLSYGSQVQTINFEPYHLMCLSGKNGHGKSALLDALTWVIWGQARKALGISKADEGLLRIGQSQMMVSLDFICNSIPYRVRREYSIHNGKATSNLDFGIISNTGKSVQTLTDKTIKATQEKINEAIGLDYDSFVNSAFLRQGQSNEFSKKSARERKEILANILGLERYEILRKKATEKIRHLLGEKEVCASYLKVVQAELNNKAEVNQKLLTVNHELDSCITEEVSLFDKQEHINSSAALLIDKNSYYAKQQMLLEHCRQNIEQNTQTLLHKVGVWRQILQKKRLLQNTENNTDRKNLEEKIGQLQTTIETYKNAHKQWQETTNKVQQVKEQTLKDHATKLQSLAVQLSSTNSTVTYTTAQCETIQKQQITIEQEQVKTHREIEHLKQSIISLDNSVKNFDQLNAIFDRRKAYYHKWVADGNAIAKELQDLQHKQQALSTTHSQCPLCTQTVLEDTRKHLVSTIEARTNLLSHQKNRLATLLKILKDKLVTDHELLQQIRTQLEEKTRLTNRLHEQETHYFKQTELISQLKKAQEQLQQELHVAHNAYNTISKQYNSALSSEDYLAADSHYQELLMRCQQQEKIFRELESYQQEYQAIVNKLSAHVHTEAKNQDVLAQIALQEARREEIAQLCSHIKKLKHDKMALDQELIKYPEHLKLIGELETTKNKQLSDLAACRHKKEKMLQEKGALEHQLLRIDQKNQEFNLHNSRLTEIDDLLTQYQAIAQALSKDGIQALLIEEAIPEIEHEANALLSKLTDNQAHLIIESVKDLKSGVTKETLDIKISDPLGIRPYELFSGGEAFRIDFALRIAISKLLARRAGATLQLLIIDEGFGSQDEDGLVHIMDTLYKIQDDFAKIIIVSHLTTMKDQFPVHFVVQKTAEGSQVNVVEQG